MTNGTEHHSTTITRASVQSLGILVSTKIIVLGHHVEGPNARFNRYARTGSISQLAN
jgi:hypothetical protein